MPSRDEVAEALTRVRWIYAKTMPTFPHDYTLRKAWPADAPPWEDVVQFIRDEGLAAKYGKTTYRYWHLNGFRYWTMGAPLGATILINRAVDEIDVPYDAIAPDYDRMFSSPADREQDAAVMNMLGDVGGRVLDVGCGTGLFLDLNPGAVESYVGIDPSRRMIASLRAKHPDAVTCCTRLEDFWFPDHARFDLIVSLYGAASYVSAEALQRIPSMLTPRGRFFLMTYWEKYRPVTYERAGIEVPHFNHTEDVIPHSVAVGPWNGFLVIEGGSCNPS